MLARAMLARAMPLLLLLPLPLVDTEPAAEPVAELALVAAA
jgi:hypothetical protein